MPFTPQYIGSRYVPIFADPAEWNSARTYEPLTIVLHEGNSYTSRQFVPTGIDISNEDFWLETGNYNAQVEAYRQEVVNYANQFNNVFDGTTKFYFSRVYDSQTTVPGNCVYIGCTFQDNVIVSDVNRVTFVNCTFIAEHINVNVSMSNDVTFEHCTFSLSKETTSSINNYHILVLNGLTSAALDATYAAKMHSNFKVDNCMFNYEPNFLSRSIIVSNMRHVTYTNNILHTNSDYVANGTDDLIDFDYCFNCIISNVTIDWSGENAIDILSCTNVRIDNVTIDRAEVAAVSIDLSDFANQRGATIDMTNYNVVVENVIANCLCGALIKNVIGCLFQYCNFTYEPSHVSTTADCFWTYEFNTKHSVVYNKADNVKIKHITNSGFKHICTTRMNTLWKGWGSLELSPDNPLVYDLPDMAAAVTIVPSNNVQYQQCLQHIDAYYIHNDSTAPVKLELTSPKVEHPNDTAGYQVSFQPFTNSFNYAIKINTYLQASSSTIGWNPSVNLQNTDAGRIEIHAW